MKKLLTMLLAIFLVVSMAACGSGDAGTTDEGGNEEASKTLVIYSPNSDSLINSVIPAFEEKHGIDVEVITAGTGDCITRIRSEMENPQGDVMFGGLSTGNFEQNPDLWEEYVSVNDSKLPEAYQNHKGFVTFYCLDGSAALLLNLDIFEELGLNPDEFKGYNDLLRPELKGKIAMGNPAKSSSAWAELTNMLLVMGEEAYDEKAWEWVAEFVKQLDGIIIDSSSAIYKGVSAGEYAVGVSYEDPCVSLLIDGATNLKLVYPEEGAVWLPAGSGIIKGAPNLENAKLFMDFLQSDEGQNIIATTTARPVNTSIANTAEEMIPFSEINVVVEDIMFCAENKSAWQERWLDLVTE